MSLADTFDKDAANYERWRPTYCPRLFADIIAYAGLTKDKAAVEIGIGTGQATGSFLALGCHVTAVEMGDNLAAFSRRKFRDYTNLTIMNCSFEDYICDGASADLVYSATAFHWIPEDIGYPKAYRMLKDGGTLALFWNRPAPAEPGGALDLRLEEIYERYMPLDTSGGESADDRQRRIAGTIGKHGFRNIEVRLYHGTRRFSAEDYVGLLRTYSDHIALEPDIKHLLETEIKQALQDFGGTITLHDTMDLFLARK